MVDTNVPSELTRETPDARVAAFLEGAGEERRLPRGHVDPPAPPESR